MDDLAIAFLPRFVSSARGRIARARTSLKSTRTADRAAVSHELHALAGEAAVLELVELADLARAAEAIARRWSAAGDARDQERCDEALLRLDAAVDRCGTT
jgi:HPt (histidine-containing phosphotransfer) domain-containing protein